MIITLPFFGTLIIAAIVYWLIPGKVWKNLFLTLVSLGFLTYLDRWAPVMILVMTVFTYLIARMIQQGKNKKIWHLSGVLGLVLLLVFFKYSGLLVTTLCSLMSFVSMLPTFRIEHLLLPLGISYITFKYISYLTDVYWGIVKPGYFLDFLLYGSLFTIYVAGPIERFERFKPQAEATSWKFQSIFLSESFERIVYGIFKKAVLADSIAYLINPVWANPDGYASYIYILAIIGFSFQIYFDFAGYSDIAIGASRMFGYKIMENFNWPYLQPNISQFWRNWHISLSDWVRDYLFFPLSRKFSGKFWQLILVPIIAMGICGIWHGAAWHFLIWGMIHGAALSLLQFWNLWKKKHPALNRLTNTTKFNYFSTALTFGFVTFAWYWFL